MQKLILFIFMIICAGNCLKYFAHSMYYMKLAEKRRKLHPISATNKQVVVCDWQFISIYFIQLLYKHTELNMHKQLGRI